MQNILIIGQGDIGKPLAEQLAKQGYQLTTMARSPKTYDGELSIKFWQKDACALTQGDLVGFDQIAIIIAPSRIVHAQGDRVQAYQKTYFDVCRHISNLNLPHIKRVLFVSSTSVYQENAGEVIDERTPARPSTDTAKVLLKAEQVLRQAFDDKCVIVRPSGIYGKTKNRMICLAKHAHQHGVPSHHYTNRIMDMDLVSCLCRIMTRDEVKPMYLISDFEVVSSAKVMIFICQKLGVPLPTIIDTPPTGKKIMPNIDRTWLRFADYRQGYEWVLQHQSSSSSHAI